MIYINKNFNVILILFLGVSSAAISGYPTLEEYIEAKQYQQAYQLARKLNTENEGDPRFDYLYGLAALNTGHYNQAVFALERVKFSNPSVIRPRLDLAQAYLKLNNKAAALDEFNSILKLSPPPAVKNNIEITIAALGAKDSAIRIKSIVKVLASFSVGYDDNVNFGADNEFIDLPVFGEVKLNPDSVKKGSGFTESRLQIQQRKVRNNQSSTFALVNMNHRDYFKGGDYNLTDVDFRTGILWNRGQRQYQLILRDRPILLGGSLYSNTIGLDAIARKALNKNKLASVSLSLENYDYKPLAEADKKRAYLSARLDFNQGNILHQISTSLGKEWPDEGEGKQYSRDIAAVSYRMTQNWNARNKSFFGINYGQYKHREAGSLSSEKRKDKRAIINAGHEMQLNDKTAILFSLRHINNNSNLDLYDASRNEVSVGVRYEWN